jgi:hypothetical protein
VQPTVEQLHVSPSEADDLASAQGGAERELDDVAGETPPVGVFVGVLLELPVGRQEGCDLALGEDRHLGHVHARHLGAVQGFAWIILQRRAILNITRSSPTWFFTVFGDIPLAVAWEMYASTATASMRAMSLSPKNGISLPVMIDPG